MTARESEAWGRGRDRGAVGLTPGDQPEGATTDGRGLVDAPPGAGAAARLPRKGGSRLRVPLLRYGRDLLSLAGGLLLVIGWTPFANLVARPLASVPFSAAKADVAVVLSGGLHRDGSLDAPSLERTIAAARLYHQGLAPRVLFTGGPCCGQSASARMARLAAELGVQNGAIFLEEDSTRTYDSAVNSAALLRRNGWRSVILVTSPLHMPRARLAFEAAGVPVYPAPASDGDVTLRSSAAERIALLRDAVHEYLGLVFYRVEGWI